MRSAHPGTPAPAAPDALPEGGTLRTAFEENAGDIYRFIYAKVGNRQAAEDLTSAVFLKAVRWLAVDRSGDSVRAWLYATARTSIADHWRTRAHDARLVRELRDSVLFCGSDPAREAPRTRARAERLLAALPEREREVLRLRFMQGLDAPRIGERLGLTAGHVRVLQLRALRRAAQLEADERGSDGS
jgi:RNA polymerase sigma-70 factor (ECF subfamily)